MDDPMNTDNCWREVELWKVHYTWKDSLLDKFQVGQLNLYVGGSSVPFPLDVLFSAQSPELSPNLCFAADPATRETYVVSLGGRHAQVVY